MSDFPSDDELIQQVQAQQAWAFEILFERYQEPLRRRLDFIVRDEAVAEDLLQEVFLLLWQRSGQWQGQGSVRSWLFRIALNQALNHLRTRRRRPEQPLETPEESEGDDLLDPPAWLVDAASLGPEQVLEQLEEQTRLRQILDDLPSEKREVFRLVHQFELSLREVADELGIPEGTAKSRLHYARQELNRQWRSEQAHKKE